MRIKAKPGFKKLPRTKLLQNIVQTLVEHNDILADTVVRMIEIGKENGISFQELASTDGKLQSLRMKAEEVEKRTKFYVEN